jgi:hypothetical protein
MHFGVKVAIVKLRAGLPLPKLHRTFAILKMNGGLCKFCSEVGKARQSGTNPEQTRCHSAKRRVTSIEERYTELGKVIQPVLDVDCIVRDTVTNRRAIGSDSFAELDSSLVKKRQQSNSHTGARRGVSLPCPGHSGRQC